MAPVASIWLVGTGPHAAEYAKVLQKLTPDDFVIVGRSVGGTRRLAETLQLDQSRVISGGLANALNDLSPTRSKPTFAIVSVGVDELVDCAVALLEAGVENILLEKPGGRNLDDLLRIQECLERVSVGAVKAVHAAHAADAANAAAAAAATTPAALHGRPKARVFVAYNRRFYASVIKAQQLIREDGGVQTFQFDFTEWTATVRKHTCSEEVKKVWLFANSSHVIDLAFFLGGRPTEVTCTRSGAGLVDFHPSGSAWTGSGTSEGGALFAFHANWAAPGRWSLEVNTSKRKLIFKPLEALQVMEHGSVQVKPVVFDGEDDNGVRFKPGMLLQTRSFLFEQDHASLLPLEKHVDMCRLFHARLAGESRWTASGGGDSGTARGRIDEIVRDESVALNGADVIANGASPVAKKATAPIAKGAPAPVAKEDAASIAKATNSIAAHQTIVLVGVGNIGLRHLESLTKVRVPLSVHVFDCDPEVTKRAQEKIKGMKTSPFFSVCFADNLDALGSEEQVKRIDLAIIATTSMPRRMIAERLWALKKPVRAMLLEKVVFPRVEDYDAVSELAQKHDTRLYVNVCQRHAWVEALRGEAKTPVNLTVEGPNWGLCCNSIHFVDMFCFLNSNYSGAGLSISNSSNNCTTSLSVSTDRLQPGYCSAKREGYVEMYGTLDCSLVLADSSSGEKADSASLELTCTDDASRQLGYVVQGSCAEFSFVWDMQGDAVTVTRGSSSSGGKEEEQSVIPFKQPYLSESNHLVVESILSSHPSATVPRYEEVSAPSKKLVAAFIGFLKAAGNDKAAQNVCPIT